MKRGREKVIIGQKHSFDILNWNIRGMTQENSQTKSKIWDNILSHSSQPDTGERGISPFGFEDNTYSSNMVPSELYLKLRDYEPSKFSYYTSKR